MKLRAGLGPGVRGVRWELRGCRSGCGLEWLDIN